MTYYYNDTKEVFLLTGCSVSGFFQDSSKRIRTKFDTYSRHFILTHISPPLFFGDKHPLRKTTTVEWLEFLQELHPHERATVVWARTPLARGHHRGVCERLLGGEL